MDKIKEKVTQYITLITLKETGVTDFTLSEVEYIFKTIANNLNNNLPIIYCN